MVRRHRRRRYEPVPLGGGASTRVDQREGVDWYVRPVTGSASVRAYRCPGCQQLIRPATPHLVVYPVEPSLQAAAAGETGLAERRHWHTSCWGRLR